MKIKQLDVAGFRSLKNVSWQPGDLNVVIGQNGTGKSNLLRILELISASARGGLKKYLEEAGGIDAILWDGQAPSVNFCLKAGANGPLVDWDENYEVHLADDLFWPEIKREVWLSKRRKAGDRAPQITTVIDRKGGQILFMGEQISTHVEIPEQESLLSLVNSLSFEASKAEATYASVKFRERLLGIRVYHNLEVGPTYPIRQSIVPRYEHTIEPNGQNLVPVLHTLYTSDREFKRNIDSAMRAAFSSDYEELTFPPAADRRIQLRVRWKSLKREQSAADLSDGTLRFLLLLVILATPQPPMVTAIDEPETGLHPSMLPIIAEFAVEASSRTQVVFTTHSPQFLSAFGKHHPTTTVAEWENGETLLHTLDKERLDYWLEDYSLGALFESGELEAMT